jgi:hypothetical protein
VTHDSSKWTGHTDAELERRYPTHKVGQTSVTSDYRRLGLLHALAQTVPPELLPVKRRAGYAFLSTFALLIGWFSLHGATRDYFAEDNRLLLILAGGVMAGYAFLEMRSRRRGQVPLRVASLTAAIVATIAAAVAYVVIGLNDYRTADISPPERTFEYGRSCGRHCTELIHQRADGSALSGTILTKPRDEAHACALAQRMKGAHGFVWVRILDRSRTPGRGQLNWPISREECYSDIPLSSLPR